LLLFTHFYWLVGADGYLNELKASIALKTESTEVVSTYVITPVFSLLLTLFKFKVILLGTIFLAFVFNKVSFKRFPKDWFTKLAFVQALVLLLFFIVMNVNKVEERWLLPLFLPFVILLVRSVSFKSVLKWHRYLSVIFICVIIAQTVRTPIEKIAHIPSDVHFGFEPLSNALNTTFSQYRNRNTIEVRIGGESLGGVAPVEQLLNFGMERDTLYFIN